MHFFVTSIMTHLFFYRAMRVVPSLQLGNVTLAGLCPVGWLASVRAINRSAWSEAEGRQARERVPCVAGEARQRRVYNTKEVCYTC